MAVVDAEHLAIGAAQLHHVKRLAQRWQLGQFALGRHQLRTAAVGHAVALAVDGGGGPQAKAAGLGQLTAGVDLAGKDVGAVVLTQEEFDTKKAELLKKLV